MRHTFCILFSLAAFALHSQTKCETWQWTGTDSVNKTLGATDYLNAQGKRIKSVLTGYKMQEYIIPDQVNFSTYRDTLELSWTSSTPDGDSMRVTYEYNDAGQCVHQDEYRFRHVVPDTGTTGMFAFADANHDTTEGKWVLITAGTYTYDRWGRKVLFISNDRKGQQSGKETWSYDRKGRVTVHESYTGNSLYRKDEYKYFKGGYSTTLILYDDYGRPRHKLSPDSAQYRPLKITTCMLDSKGRKVEVRVSDDKQNQKSRKTMSYYPDGKLAREEYYDADDKVVLVHEYIYK